MQPEKNYWHAMRRELTRYGFDQDRSFILISNAGFVTALLAVVVFLNAGIGSSQALAQKAFDCAHGPDTYRVRNVPSWDRLNVRSGPGVRNDIVGTISATGSGIQCVGPCQKNWCRIDWRGMVGWVNMRFLGE